MANSGGAKQNAWVLICMAAVLAFGAAQAIFVTAQEYDPAILVWMHFGLDVAMTLLSVILLIVLARSSGQEGPRGLAILAGLVGIVAGAIRIAARFTSDHGWWTGHFNYRLG